MDEFTIYCTPEQTAMAFIEFNVPLRQVFYDVQIDETLKEYHLIRIGGKLYEIPTAEQMLGWLHSKKKLYVFVEPMHTWARPNDWSYHPRILIEDCDYEMNDYNYQDMIPISSSRDLKTYKTPKDAFLAAIDKVLEYLENNK